MTPSVSHVVQKYQYGEMYQLKILAVLVRYPQFIHRHGDVIRPEYFEYNDMSTICKQVLDFYRKYSIVPTLDTFMAWIQDYQNKFHLPETLARGLTNLVTAIFTCDLADGDAVRDTAIGFARRQSLKLAVMNIQEQIERFDDNYDTALHEIQSALLVGQGLGSLGVEAYGTIPRLSAMAIADSPYSSRRKFPTPFGNLNQVRMGGLGPGELMVIIGGSGQGKSIIKGDCAVTAMEYGTQGQWIAIATLELSEFDYLLRLGARILRCTTDEIVLNSQTYSERCLRLPNDKKIYVKWFPPGETTTGHLRSWISALSAELGITPCMLIVDYPDFMIPTRGETDSLYINNAKIYNELYVLLNDYQMVGIVSSQLDRAHQNSNQSRASHIANSIAKLYNADIVGTINQTEDDIQNEVGRIWWDKVRRGRSKFFSCYRINYAGACVTYDESVAQLVQQGRGGSAQVAPPTPQTQGWDPSQIPFAPPPTGM